MTTILRDLFGPGTWGAGGNLVAWVLCGALGVAGAFLFRDLLGRRLAAWFHKHHGEHLRGELEALEERLGIRLDEHHAALKEHVSAEVKAAAAPKTRMTKAARSTEGGAQ